ncbi:MAG: outer membrane porin, OprD family [Pseudomonas fluorescens]|nr:outer membrane porin, OprD family [Pseudomonas fluorescens]
MILSPQDSRAAIALCFCLLTTHALAEESAKDSVGFFEGASLGVLSRNFYLNSDYRSPSPTGKNYKAEWAQGFISAFESGFTPGTVGFGLDAHAFLGLKLDGGKGHSGTGLLPVSSDGRSESNYSSGGGAIKLKASNTTLAFGEMEVESPVFDTADKRLQPEYATGFLLNSREIDGMNLQAGLAGAIDNTAYSLSGQYTLGAHGFTLAYQKVDGDTPFDFVGGDSIYLANSIKYADFNGARERSWQVRYDLDLTALGIPGLKFMTRYVTGDQIDGTHAPQGGAYNPFDPATGTFAPQQGDGGKHWERDIDLKYMIQTGAAKDLSVQVSHVSHRANEAQAGDDIDRIYVVIQYPLGF